MPQPNAESRSAAKPLYRRFWGHYQKGPTQVWVTTGGKDHWTLVPRWRLALAVFSRKDVWL